MKTILLLILLLSVPFAVHAEDFGRPSMKIFSAKVSNVRLAGHLIEKGKDMDDNVSVTVQSIIFRKELEIPDVRKAKNYNQPAIDTLIRFIRTCINGSVEEIVKFWVKSEKIEQKELYVDPQVQRMTHEHFSNHPGFTIVGLIFKGNKTTILTRGLIGTPEYVAGFSLVNEEGGHFLTNSDKDDLDLAIIEASFSPTP